MSRPAAVGASEPLSKVIGDRVISVVIVDKQEFSRIGIERVLESHPGVKLVASVNDLADFDFATVDVDAIIVGEADLEGTTHDLTAVPVQRPTIVICRAIDSVSAVMATLRNGPLGVISRMTSPAELLFAVDAVSRGGCYISSELAAGIGAAAAQGTRSAEGPGLAPRELETATLIEQGLTHRQVARRMGLTEATVSTYVKRLRAKLKAGNKAELTRRVIELGYLPSGNNLQGIDRFFCAIMNLHSSMNQSRQSFQRDPYHVQSLDRYTARSTPPPKGELCCAGREHLMDVMVTGRPSARPRVTIAGPPAGGWSRSTLGLPARPTLMRWRPRFPQAA